MTPHYRCSAPCDMLALSSVVRLEPAKESIMSNQARKLVHSDIKPENPPERAAHYLDVPNMPWEATKFPGIKMSCRCMNIPRSNKPM
jgi:hypothetical protein